MKQKLTISIFSLLLWQLTVGQLPVNLVLQPDALDGKDALAWLLHPNQNMGNDPQANILAWTNQGALTHTRYYVAFDLSSIPVGSVIQTAELFLYNFPGAPSCNGSHLQLSGSNEMVIRRITGNWDESGLTWNNQPSLTDTNMVITPPSTGPHQDYSIEVTALVQDMVDNPVQSFGFGMILLTEDYYRSLIFASSDNPNPALHPKLAITYLSNPPVSIIQVDTCESYYWPQTGISYFQSGTYYDTLTSALGLDSIIGLELNIANDTVIEISITACDGFYYWESANDTLTTPGEYSVRLQTVTGCDSTIILTIDFAESFSDTVTAESCESFFWPETGQYYGTSGTYQAVYTNSSGCDSIIFLDCTIHEADEFGEIVSSCGPYTWNLNGQEYTASGVYAEVFTNQNGCDSTYYLQLEVNQLSLLFHPNDTLVEEGQDASFHLATNPTNASYQWEHNNGTGFQPLTDNLTVSGSTTADLYLSSIDLSWSNSLFRCLVSMGACADTSNMAILQVRPVGVDEFPENTIGIFPNPAKESIQIQSEMPLQGQLFDLRGNLIFTFQTKSSQIVQLPTLSESVYFIHLYDPIHSTTYSKKIHIKHY